MEILSRPTRLRGSGPGETRLRLEANDPHRKHSRYPRECTLVDVDWVETGVWDRLGVRVRLVEYYRFDVS